MSFFISSLCDTFLEVFWGKSCEPIASIFVMFFSFISTHGSDGGIVFSSFFSVNGQNPLDECKMDKIATPQT